MRLKMITPTDWPRYGAGRAGRGVQLAGGANAHVVVRESSCDVVEKEPEPGWNLLAPPNPPRRPQATRCGSDEPQHH